MLCILSQICIAVVIEIAGKKLKYQFDWLLRQAMTNLIEPDIR